MTSCSLDELENTPLFFYFDYYYTSQESKQSIICDDFVDYISSPTATVFPVKELCAVCRERNVISVIDGAHAPGQVKLDMDDIKPDFFVGK